MAASTYSFDAFLSSSTYILRTSVVRFLFTVSNSVFVVKSLSFSSSEVLVGTCGMSDFSASSPTFVQLSVPGVCVLVQ